MSELNVTCPECGARIEIAEQLAAPLVEAERERIAKQEALKAEKAFATEREAAQAAIAEKDAKLKAAEQKEFAALKAKEEADEAVRNAELTVKRKIEAERKKIEEQAAAKATEDVLAKLKAVEGERDRQAEKLKKAQEAELAAIKAKAEADEAKRELELTVAREVAEKSGKIREQALKEAADENRLAVAEKDKQLQDLRKQIEELRRKGNSGSQQLRGDVQEIDVTDILQRAFPGDQFERVGKGQKGADVVHSVIGPGGLKCGSILWESKRTKAWSQQWLPKLRTDQRELRADIAALVSEVLPDGVDQFDCIESVWVTGATSIVPMAMALRQGLVETAMARQAMTGSNSKKELVYNYLTGQEFRQRIGGLVEVYVQMREDLDREKRSFTRQWKAREKQLERFMLSAAGMYGDLQGIIGANLLEVEGLELPLLEDASDDEPQALKNEAS